VSYTISRPRSCLHRTRSRPSAMSWDTSIWTPRSCTPRWIWPHPQTVALPCPAGSYPMTTPTFTSPLKARLEPSQFSDRGLCGIEMRPVPWLVWTEVPRRYLAGKPRSHPEWFVLCRSAGSAIGQTREHRPHLIRERGRFLFAVGIPEGDPPELPDDPSAPLRAAHP